MRRGRVFVDFVLHPVGVFPRVRYVVRWTFLRKSEWPSFPNRVEDWFMTDFYSMRLGPHTGSSEPNFYFGNSRDPLTFRQVYRLWYRTFLPDLSYRGSNIGDLLVPVLPFEGFYTPIRRSVCAFIKHFCPTLILTYARISIRRWL